MLILIKSAPDSVEAKRAVRLARDAAADIALLQDAVYLAVEDRLEGFCGTAHALEEDLRMRGVAGVGKGVRLIDYDRLVDLIAGEDRVLGTF